MVSTYDDTYRLTAVCSKFTIFYDELEHFIGGFGGRVVGQTDNVKDTIPRCCRTMQMQDGLKWLNAADVDG